MTATYQPPAPKQGKKRLITSALPYVNNAPHLGNIIGCVLSADVFARFSRLRGYETLYICGTDGYGTATETKAKAEGVTPREICERFHQVHTKIYDFFDIKFDAFGKTFSEVHTEVVQQMFQDLEQAGQLVELDTEQTYCNHDQMFLADRFVEGTCPHCNYEDARGDQCESCGKLLNPEDLKQPRCAICGNTPELKTTKHLYLNLPALSTRLEAWHKKSMTAGQWTHNAETTTLSWLKQGLNPRPITRDLKWGVPVPKPGYEDKVFYVWFDAPIGYISITKAFFPDTWEDWWRQPESTELYQFIGKDNIPFHSVIFPASLIGSEQPWTMLHHLNSTEFLNYENTKFSKSKGVGIFGTDAMELDFPVDFWRFYLLAARPEKQDTNFNWNEFFDRINNDLIDNVCNLVNRVLVYYQKNFPGPLAEYSYDHKAHQEFMAEVRNHFDEATTALEAGGLKEGLRLALAVGHAGNRFFQEQEPWKKIKEDKAYVQETMTLLVHLIRDLGVMLSPYMPDTAARILKMTATPAAKWQDLGQFRNMTGITLGTTEILFQKLDPKQIDPLRDRFGGNDGGLEQVDIRVGKVLAAEPHPVAEHLYVEKIDLGDGKPPRTVCSALKKHYSLNDLVGKHVLVVANLAPADFKGVPSEGMILVVQKNKKLELLSHPDWPVGERLYRQGYAKDGDRPEISFEEFTAIPLEVHDHSLVYKSQPLLVADTPVKSDKLIRGKVK